MVSKLSSEVQQLRIGSEFLKTQLRDLQEAPSHVPSIRHEVASSVTAKSYRDFVRTVGGGPGAIDPARNCVLRSSIVADEKSCDGDFIMVIRKKQVSPFLQTVLLLPAL
jgi:hypothetical protein